MDGDIAHLNKMLEVTENYGIPVAVDEAHSTFVLGSTGRGICEHFDISSHRIAMIMGTTSKAVGAEGGFIAASRGLIDAFRHNSRQNIFATALPPALYTAISESFRLIQEESWRVAKLRENSASVQAELSKMGYNIGNPHSAIIPVIIGDSRRVNDAWVRMMGRGIYIGAVTYPAVPEGISRFRITVSAGHEPEQINRLIDAFGEERDYLLKAPK